MGISVEHVLSDDHHYGPFICTICQRVSALDAVVTTNCSHPFCMSCLDELVLQKPTDCHCPSCNSDLLPPPTTTDGTMVLGNGTRVDAEPLAESQPLAYLVFTQIKVKCPHGKREECDWEGNYADLETHLEECGHENDGQPNKANGEPRHSLTDAKSSQHSQAYSASSALQSSDDPIEKAEILKDRANAIYSDGHYAEASKIYTQAITILKETETSTKFELQLHSTIYCNRAAAHLREGIYESCVNDCNAALELNEKYPKAFVRKAKALIEMGRYEGACSCLEDGIRKNPESEDLVDEFKKARKMDDRVKKIEETLERQDYSNAKDLMSVFLDNMRSDRLILAAARVDAGLGLTEPALDKCLHVLRKDPDNADALQVEGIVTYLAGDFEDAIEILNESLQFDSNNEATKEILRNCRKGANAILESRSCLVNRKYKRAIEQLTIAIEDCMPVPKKSPLFSILHVERAEAWMVSKQHFEALTDCITAIDATEDNVAAWMTKAEVYHKLGRHETARAELLIVKRTWGAKVKGIQDAYNKADFEVRVQQVDMELRNMVASADARSQVKTDHESSVGGRSNRISSDKDHLKEGRRRKEENAKSENMIGRDPVTYTKGSTRRSSTGEAKMSPRYSIEGAKDTMSSMLMRRSSNDGGTRDSSPKKPAKVARSFLPKWRNSNG